MDRSTASTSIDVAIGWVKARNVERLTMWAKSVEDVNSADAAGNTIIHWCAVRGYHEGLTAMLRQGASVSIRNANSSTALHCAAASGSKPCVEILLRHGADPHAINAQGRSSMDVARSRGHAHLDAILEIAASRDRPRLPAVSPTGVARVMEVSRRGDARVARSPSATPSEQWDTNSELSAARGNDRRSPSMATPAEPSPLRPHADVTVPSCLDGILQPIAHSTAADIATLPMGNIVADLLNQNSLLEKYLSLQQTREQVVGCGICEGPAKRRAVVMCRECSDDAASIPMCADCWENEHRPRRTRHHKRVPLPPSDSRDTAMRQDVVDAKNLLMVQQQLLRLVSHVTSAPQSAAATQTEAHEGARHQSTMTTDHSHRYYSEAMEQLRDIKEQLEAEVSHSRDMLHEFSIDLLAVQEGRNRAELEAEAWREHDLIARPSPVAMLPKKKRFATASAVAQCTLMVSPTVNVAVGTGAPRATSTTGVSPIAIALPKGIDVGVDAALELEEGVPMSRKASAIDVPRRVPTNAIATVHGEKHLPGEPQMLLVEWSDPSKEDEWVAAYEIAHCDAVVEYMKKFDRSAVDLPGTPNIFGHGSPLGETERTDLMRELEELKSDGTRGLRRENSRSGQDLVEAVSRPLASLRASPEGHHRGTPFRLREPPVPSPPPMPPPQGPQGFLPTVHPNKDDLEVVKRYERKLAELEQRHELLKRTRDEQEEYLQQLRQRQQLVDSRTREQVHREYEACASDLVTAQPDVGHPLYATTDRQAALLLHVLQEEIRTAERERALVESVTKGKKPQRHGSLPPVGRSPSPHDAERPRASPPRMRVAPHYEGEGNPRPILAGGKYGADPRKRALPPLAEPPPEVKPYDPQLNRVLYEEYFYQHQREASARIRRDT